MNAIGIIIAKENSNRFPGKNYFNVNGKFMFAHNVDLLKECRFIDSVFVATNSPIIKDYCLKNGIFLIDRGPNVSADEEPFLSVLKFVYQSLNIKADIIISILANTINHNQESLENAFTLMKNCPELNEIRSFDKYGMENGIMFFRENVVLTAPAISSNMGSVFSGGREIHYKREVENA